MRGFQTSCKGTRDARLLCVSYDHDSRRLVPSWWFGLGRYAISGPSLAPFRRTTLYDGTDDISCKDNRPRKRRSAPQNHSSRKCPSSSSQGTTKPSGRAIDLDVDFPSFLRPFADRCDGNRLLHTPTLATSSALHTPPNISGSSRWTIPRCGKYPNIVFWEVPRRYCLDCRVGR